MWMLRLLPSPRTNPGERVLANNTFAYFGLTNIGQYAHKPQFRSLQAIDNVAARGPHRLEDQVRPPSFCDLSRDNVLVSRNEAGRYREEVRASGMGERFGKLVLTA